MTGQSYTYTVLGLTVRSDFEMEFLEPVTAAEDEIDLHILRCPEIMRTRPYPFEPYFAIYPDHQYFHWTLIGAVLIEDLDRVLVAPHEGVEDRLVSQPVLGLVMSIVLERRGLLCLHAGAVNIDGEAAVFMGDKGAGKSTTEAAMIKHGYRPITDDMVAVEDATNPASDLRIRPGYSCMKLWPDAIEALALEPHEDDREVHHSLTKIQKKMPVPIAQETVPMGAIFVLNRTEDVTRPHAERLPVHEALRNVLRYTFMERYGETKLGQDHLIGHMRRCSAIASRVPVYMLHIPADLAALPQLTEEIASVTRTKPG